MTTKRKLFGGTLYAAGLTAMMSAGAPSADAQTFDFANGYINYAANNAYSYTYGAMGIYQSTAYGPAYAGAQYNTFDGSYMLSLVYPTIIGAQVYDTGLGNLAYSLAVAVAYVEVSQQSTVNNYWDLTSNYSFLSIYDVTNAAVIEYQAGGGNYGYSQVTLDPGNLYLIINRAVVGIPGQLDVDFAVSIIPAPAALPVFGLAAMATARRRRKRE